MSANLYMCCALSSLDSIAVSCFEPPLVELRARRNSDLSRQTAQAQVQLRGAAAATAIRGMRNALQLQGHREQAPLLSAARQPPPPGNKGGKSTGGSSATASTGSGSGGGSSSGSGSSKGGRGNKGKGDLRTRGHLGCVFVHAHAKRGIAGTSMCGACMCSCSVRMCNCRRIPVHAGTCARVRATACVHDLASLAE